RAEGGGLVVGVEVARGERERVRHDPGVERLLVDEAVRRGAAQLVRGEVAGRDGLALPLREHGAELAEDRDRERRRGLRGRRGGRAAPRGGPHVLFVGRWHHSRGHYRSIRAAVDAAKPGDWILVAPGDYHEQADRSASRGPQPAKTPAGIVITKPNLHIR